MRSSLTYIKLYWYFALNWNPVLACFILWHEIRGERKYKIATAQPVALADLTISRGNIAKSSRYEAVNYFVLEALLGKMRSISPEESFTDIGCGKGRSMVVAAYFGFSRIKGVDFAKEVCGFAELHMKRTQERFPGMRYRVYHQNVLDYAVQTNESVFFLFNPFDEETLSAFLEKVDRSLEDHPRTVYFLYASPRFIETFFEFEYDPIYRIRRLKWLDGVILKKVLTNKSRFNAANRLSGI